MPEIYLNLTPSDQQLVEQEAKKRGLTVQEFIQQVIDGHLQDVSRKLQKICQG